MNFDKGAVHIPVVLALLVAVTGTYLFRDDISNAVEMFVPKENVMTAGDQDESENLVSEESEDEIDKPSIFSDLLQTSPSAEEQSMEGPIAEETTRQLEDLGGCDLKKYMAETENNLPFVSIIKPLPEDKIEYPQEWPQDLIYPEDLKLVDAGTGKLTEESAMMYKAFMLSESDPSAATCRLVKYFEDKNWEVSELVSRDDLGFIVVLMDKDGIGTGLLNTEAVQNDYGKTKITLSVFPEAVQSGDQ